MGRAFVCNQIPGREIHCLILPTGDLRSSNREAAARLAAGTVRPRSEFGPKRVPGTSQRRELDEVSLSPGVSLYPSASRRPGRRRRAKRGGKARPGLPKLRGGGAQGTLRARAVDRKPGDNPFPSACSRGTSSPGNPRSRSQPGEQRVWEARSGSENRGGGGRKAGGGGRGGRLPALPLWTE